MADLKGSKTHTNLKEAFAGESQANRRYIYFAKVADVEGHPDLAGLFRDTAEGETGHAHGHLDYLKRVVVGYAQRIGRHAGAGHLPGPANLWPVQRLRRGKRRRIR